MSCFRHLNSGRTISHFRIFAPAMQKQKWVFVLITLMSLTRLAIAQDDPILYSVADINVPVSEFKYIYTKNNRDNADYSQGVSERFSLDLYTRFKLKVKKKARTRNSIPSQP